MFIITITTYRATEAIDSMWYAWADDGIVGIGPSEESAVKDALNTLEVFYGVDCAATRTR